MRYIFFGKRRLVRLNYFEASVVGVSASQDFCTVKRVVDPSFLVHGPVYVVVCIAPILVRIEMHTINEPSVPLATLPCEVEFDVLVCHDKSF